MVHDMQAAEQVPSTCVCTIALRSLVLRPHFITKENSLVNKVEFLRLVYAFSISVTNIQNIVPHPLKKVSIGNFFFLQGEVLHTQNSSYHILGIGLRNLTLFTRLLPESACVLWAQDYSSSIVTNEYV